jgi:putative component of toxin-antitoxin plasmid stabilization module
MPKFTIAEIKAISCRQEFDQLVIDGEGQLDIFEKDLADTTYKSEFKTLLTYMEYLGNNGSLPKTKFRDVTPKGEKVKEYEFKSKHLRIYVVQQINGKIVILGGYKSSQDKDFIKFRSLKKQFLSSLNNNL